MTAHAIIQNQESIINSKDREIAQLKAAIEAQGERVKQLTDERDNLLKIVKAVRVGSGCGSIRGLYGPLHFAIEDAVRRAEK